jgi:hypothetical protein
VQINRCEGRYYLLRSKRQEARNKKKETGNKKRETRAKRREMVFIFLILQNTKFRTLTEEYQSNIG